MSAPAVEEQPPKMAAEKVEPMVADPEKGALPEGQAGVRAAEAMTLSWSKTSVTITYGCMWSLYCVNAFQASITGNLGPYILSDFGEHSLVTLIGIVSQVMAAATYMPVAKIVNLWGRPFGFTLMISLATIGLIMMTTCKNVQTYAASQVFYSVGFTGMIFSIDIITADTSTLRNRGLAYAFTSSPYLITAFAGPKIAERFHETNWRWAYGIWCILLPVVAIPLLTTLYLGIRKGKKQGLLQKEDSGRTWMESIIYHAVEFDLLGIFLLAAGFILALLPFTLANSEEHQWKSAKIITMLVIGFVVLIVFAIYEKFFSSKPFIPFHLLTSRTALGACALSFTYQISYYCWGSYFTSFLQVVNNQSITHAGYIANTFDMVSGVWLFIVGFLINRTGRFKWLIMCAVPLYMLGIGLMIYFRQPGQAIGYIVMCQIFAALGGGTMIITQQVAVTSVAEHNDVASMLAMLGLFGYLGGAVGNSISGAIWTHTLPQALQDFLPESAKADWADIYGSLDIQLSYPVGSPERDAIMDAYGFAQKRMLIAGTAIMTLSLVWMMVIKNVNVKTSTQVKGVLF
ncbi:major facilitator superfamily domain-containing protein [Aspergillus pseudoustus]|uniref:Major facilitator superfamily domain-containing protein n=1 Tax=Aspergillus pseudoustus TaxID=1810923 RepID=A0ABR4JAP1_9EURO